MTDKCIHPLNIQSSFYCEKCYNHICYQCKPKHNHIQTLISLDVYLNRLKSSFTYLDSQIDNITHFQNIYNNFIILKNAIQTFSLQLDECYHSMSLILTNTSLASIILNAKDALNSFRLLSDKDDNYPLYLIELSERVTDSLNMINSTDKIVSQFNLNLADFSIGLNMIVKYSQERQINIENYYLMNNNHMNDFIQEKVKEDNKEIRQKMELLQIENEKLYQMNLNHLKDTKDNNTNNTTLNSKKTIIDFAKDEKELIALVQHIIVDKIVMKTHYNIIEQYDAKSIVTMTFQQLNTLIKVPELNETFYSSEQIYSNTFNDKGINELIYQSPLFNSYISSVIHVIKCEMDNYLYESIAKVLQGIEEVILQSYLKQSKSIKGLKSIDLKGIGVSDSQMKRVALIANNTNISELYLQNNKIRDNGIKILFNTLNEDNKLKSIYLNNNGLTKTSLSHFKEAIAFKVKAFENLKIISFENNNITADKGNKDLLFEIRKLIKTTIHI